MTDLHAAQVKELRLLVSQRLNQSKWGNVKSPYFGMMRVALAGESVSGQL